MKVALFADPGNSNIYEISVYFKCKIHNERLPAYFFCFLDIFRTVKQTLWGTYFLPNMNKLFKTAILTLGMDFLIMNWVNNYSLMEIMVDIGEQR